MTKFDMFYTVMKNDIVTMYKDTKNMKKSDKIKCGIALALGSGVLGLCGFAMGGMYVLSKMADNTKSVHHLDTDPAIIKLLIEHDRLTKK
jgi:hypothetical protein